MSEYRAEVDQISYNDPGYGSRGSDKFYRAYLLEAKDGSDTRVLFQWGRQGSKGQSQVLLFPSKYDAEVAIERKLRSKRHEGYEMVPRRGDIDDGKLEHVGEDLLALAGVRDGVVSKPRPDVADGVFDPSVFAYAVDQARRLAFGPPEDQLEALTVRDGLLDQLSKLRGMVATSEGQVEFLGEVIKAGLEATV